MKKDYFKEIIGYEEIKEELEKILDVILHKEKYEKLNALIPAGVLLNGDPGLGKTMLAKSFIEASKLNSVIIRKDKPNGSFIFEIKEKFDEAVKNAPSIIFLDDMDKFAPDDSTKNREEFSVLQTCIDNVKGKNVFVIATTNSLKNIPDSLFRSGRIDKKITVEAPCISDAKLIVDYYLKKKECVKEVDCELIAKLLLGESCATLEKVINEAGIIAGWAKKDAIDMDDLIRAILQVHFNGCELKKGKTDYYKKIAAYHEAGHTLIQEILEPNTVNLVTIKNYSSATGGLTCVSNSENYSIDLKYSENKIKTLLAGKAAIEMVFGKVDTGAKKDIDKAYDIALSLCEDYCAQDFTNFDRNLGSDTLRDNLRIQVANQLSKNYLEVKNIITNNRDKLDRIANSLMNNDYLIDKDIQNLIA